jgi:hypothetical protein
MQINFKKGFLRILNVSGYSKTSIPAWLLRLISADTMFVIYGLLGPAGYWCSRVNWKYHPYIVNMLDGRPGCYGRGAYSQQCDRTGCRQRYMRDGLVAAMGVHFWTDIIWHVIWLLFWIGL